ncbi:hypothetical protein DFH09DRAFT_1152661 [Mycena vulgaris]|nr:hypothetical protein DFH09DRAFT_1152661 [Mycena vulgaris]
MSASSHSPALHRGTASYIQPASAPSYVDILKPDDGDELASTKLWAVYIAEAERYDKSLVEGWKSDMEGLLIFAGLFSASLTAFIVESYKTLTPDQGAIAIAVLAQISRQLDARVNATSVDISRLMVFQPASSSLVCNMFWFLSLGFSLSCALIATLVEQWSRDFIQKTEMRPSPIIRARIYSYLYFGLQRFGMHTTVACLPILMHVSLLLFLAGLVAFLQPINTPLMAIAALMLGAMSTTYTYLTVLPIFSSDSPYRTPLSNLAWRYFLRVRAAFSTCSGRSEDDTSSILHDRSFVAGDRIPTMVDAMARDATQKSYHRDARDVRAIQWTVESLTDNNELDAFVEALPDLIRGPNGRRRLYDGIINMLLETPGIQLISRVEDLLRSCDSALLPPEMETRRRISCIRAIWSLAYFAASDGATRRSAPVFDLTLLRFSGHTSSSFSISTYYLIRWCGFCALSNAIRDALSMLAADNTIPVQDPRVCLTVVQNAAEAYGYVEFSRALSTLVSLDPLEQPLLVQQAREALKSVDNYAYDMLLEYLRNSAPLRQMPYEFQVTCFMIQPLGVHSTSAIQLKLKDTFISVVGADPGGDGGVDHIDITIDILFFLLQAGPDCMDVAFAAALTRYFKDRDGEESRLRSGLIRSNPAFIGHLITRSLACGQSSYVSALANIWGLCLFFDPPLAVFDEATITAISGGPSYPISSSVILVLKSHVMMSSVDLPADQLESLMDRLGVPTLPSQDTIERFNESRFVILVEFLEQHSSLSRLNDWLNMRMMKTFNHLVRACPPFIPAALQTRFATWFRGGTNRPTVLSDVSIVGEIISVWRWESPPHPLALAHFDDPAARSTIHEALTTYAGNLLATDEDSLMWLRSIDTVLAILNLPVSNPLSSSAR